MTRAVRWTALFAGVTLALVYLNSAAYSAWAGGGPPTSIREAWMHRAFSHLCYAGAAVVSGLTLFRVIRRPLRLDRAALALVVLTTVLLAAPDVRRFLLMGHCLDSGGHWDAAAFRCQR